MNKLISYVYYSVSFNYYGSQNHLQNYKYLSHHNPVKNCIFVLQLDFKIHKSEFVGTDLESIISPKDTRKPVNKPISVIVRMKFSHKKNILYN